MKNGYYISTFLAVGELQSAYDIKLRHDQAIALWKKSEDQVELISYWELERFSGWKQHTYTFETKEQILKVISYLLSTKSLTLDDIQEIWGTPIIDTGLNYDSSDMYPEISYHSICHLFTSLLFDSEIGTKKDMVILSLDSGPDNIVQLDGYHKNYYAGAFVSNGKIHVFPIQSPGKLWSNSKKRFGLREGSLMALSSACESKCNENFDKEIQLYDEKSLENALDCLDDLAYHIKEYGYTHDGRFTEEENYISAYMKQIDLLSRKIVSQEIEKIIKRFDVLCSETYLGLSGGFSLNCPINTFLMDKFGFKELIVPPCTNDCGEALGIGLYAFYKKMGKFPKVSIEHPFYGNSVKDYSDSTLKRYSKFIEKVDCVAVETISKDIEENIIIWVQDRAEMGPRALGHRSILGNPAKVEVKEQLNKIKKRQWWRPVAPIVLEDQVKNMFEQSRKSPFMLEAFKLKDEWIDKVPSIVHLDGTSRVQSLNKNDNSLLYQVIESFYKRTGIPAICNTSLNDQGEPIIQETEQAIEFALRKGIKIVYINGVRLQLKNCEEFCETLCVERNSWLFYHMEKSKADAIKKRDNPFNLNKNVLTFYFDNPEIYLEYSLLNEKDCKVIERLAEEFMKKKLISLKRDLL